MMFQIEFETNESPKKTNKNITNFIHHKYIKRSF